MSEANQQVVKRFYLDVIAHGRLELLDQVLAPSYREHRPYSRDAFGLCSAQAWLEALDYAFPSRMVIIEELSDGGDYVHCLWSVYSSALDEAGALDFSGNDTFRLYNGKIVERWSSEHTSGLLQQMATRTPYAEPVCA
jgi:predicted SnoaL-like aldol condensation-catalyzing enzyme